MATQLVLTVIGGPHAGERHVFEQPTVCVLGRSPSCWLQLGPEDFTVSRRHCLLIVNPPHLSVQDLGSLNGTYVNGKSIGHRLRGYMPEDGELEDHTQHPLKEGDILQVGHTFFRVEIQETASAEETEGQQESTDLRPRCTPSAN